LAVGLIRFDPDRWLDPNAEYATGIVPSSQGRESSNKAADVLKGTGVTHVQQCGSSAAGMHDGDLHIKGRLLPDPGSPLHVSHALKEDGRPESHVARRFIPFSDGRCTHVVQSPHKLGRPTSLDLSEIIPVMQIRYPLY
jgi:hypothetical protein